MSEFGSCNGLLSADAELRPVLPSFGREFKAMKGSHFAKQAMSQLETFKDTSAETVLFLLDLCVCVYVCVSFIMLCNK